MSNYEKWQYAIKKLLGKEDFENYNELMREQGKIIFIEELEEQDNGFFERYFLKQASKYLKIYIDTENVILLESNGRGLNISYVMYEDNFGRQWQIHKNMVGKYEITESYKIFY
jgi:hypothetical protein